LQKNLYIMRNTNHTGLTNPPAPKCDLPTLKLLPTGSLSLHKPNGLRVDGTNDFYRFLDDAVALRTHFDAGYLDVRYLIFSFFLLSCLFQAVEALFLSPEYQGPRLLRFVEYSISSSVMILAIAIQVGLTDIYILVCIFTLMFATNLLGLVAELLCFLAETSQGALSIWLWTLPHGIAWVTCLVAYAPLLDAYLQSTRCSDRSPPGFVHVIIFLEFFMFISFGFVQVYSLASKTTRYLLTGAEGYQMHPVAATGASYYYTTKTPEYQSQDITDTADLAYIVLSFTAKTLLAWLILAPVLI
jgi:hypothetical protein